MKTETKLQYGAGLVQEAIDQVSQIAPDADGFRGTVLLQRGRYCVGDTLVIAESGVVLRGEGSGEDGTVLFADAPRRYTVISAGRPTEIDGVSVEREEMAGTRRAVTDEFVSVGAFRLTVSDASPFSVGNAVVVERPATPLR